MLSVNAGLGVAILPGALRELYQRPNVVTFPIEGEDARADTVFVWNPDRLTGTGELFRDIRRAAPNAFLLVPGVGAQGGSLEEVCRYGMIADCGLLVNSSRAIIYADGTERFALVAAEKAKEMADQMRALLDNKL